MEYDRDDSFPFNFEPNGIPFGSKSKEKSLTNHESFCNTKEKYKTMPSIQCLRYKHIMFVIVRKCNR